MIIGFIIIIILLPCDNSSQLHKSNISQQDLRTAPLTDCSDISLNSFLWTVSAKLNKTKFTVFPHVLLLSSELCWLSLNTFPWLLEKSSAKLCSLGNFPWFKLPSSYLYVHGRRSLEGCSPWGRWGSDTTERLHFHFSLSCIGEGNGSPLQCSCLENPRDGGAWWAAVYGVAQSRTRLKRLSSSSSSSFCVYSVFRLLIM